jgi:hypothetical protein
VSTRCIRCRGAGGEDVTRSVQAPSCSSTLHDPVQSPEQATCAEAFPAQEPEHSPLQTPLQVAPSTGAPLHDPVHAPEHAAPQATGASVPKHAPLQLPAQLPSAVPGSHRDAGWASHASTPAHPASHVASVSSG